MTFIYFIVQNDCVVLANINCQLIDHYRDNCPKLQEIRNKWLCCMKYLQWHSFIRSYWYCICIYYTTLYNITTKLLWVRSFRNCMVVGFTTTCASSAYHH